MGAVKEQVAGNTTQPDVLSDEEQLLYDYWLANVSREASYIGRKEVLTGKAKFGIFGDGKEAAQLAMAKVFEDGDFRSGYYRDQTFMMAINQRTLKQFFAQLYADPDLAHEPATGGRQMNSHFATRSLDENGHWRDLTAMKNTSADVSPTGSQMPRLVGLGYASRLYRELEELKDYKQFSNNGREVAFGTIGNATVAEGMFWEALNAIGLLNVPVAISIWDDEYGISVPNKYQITKSNISDILAGFAYDDESGQGFYLYTAKGWDFPQLVRMYEEGVHMAREYHIPVVFHIQEMTQPQGHSTSGSHERYKSKERLEWEQQMDCIYQMRYWLVNQGLASADKLDELENDARQFAKDTKNQAYKAYQDPIKAELKEAAGEIDKLAKASAYEETLKQVAHDLRQSMVINRKAIIKAVHQALRHTIGENTPQRTALVTWLQNKMDQNRSLYNSHLHSQSDQALTNIAAVPAEYPEEGGDWVNGYEILNHFFDSVLSRDPRVFAIGEDLGRIGGVNQGMAGLQDKYGELRVGDTGIREVTIVGQGIGAAMRGLRPIAEIQYLDYVLYALQIMSDDLATVQFRTKGGQKAPLIIRTRGHRFEGIWHAGSPMGGILNLCRGMAVCVPRNMTQAAGLYNALLQSDEPGLVVERLNAYRSKEQMPTNLDAYTVPVGRPEILQEGHHVTIVTYGACVGIAEETLPFLEEAGISAELIDVQTLLPFDEEHTILASLQKTNRVVFMDEDVPGGASAFMMEQALEQQGGYWQLDSEPTTVTAKPHRPPYATDGDYFAKPHAEDLFDAVYGLMHEFDPANYPAFYG